MNKYLDVCAAAGFAALQAAAVTMTAGNTEVVVAPKAPSVVRFAAEEMTNYLSRVLSSEVPLVTEPTAGRKSFVLGVNEWSKAAGLDPAALPRDSYIVKAGGDRVYIAGVDDAKYDLHRFLERKTGYGEILKAHERATLFGVYGCLEKYAGVRFILPDEELGTIVPKTDAVTVPDGEEKVTPDFLLRNPYFGGDGRWYVDSYAGKSVKSLLWLRHRLSSYYIPCCHGSRDFKYIERFGKTHPEYLARKKDGSVRLDPKQFAAYQYCWSNPGFREELYQDVKAYLTGQPASSRGLDRWGSNCAYGKYVDIMPEDSFQGCSCEGCQKAYTGRMKFATDRSSAYANDLMWGVCREIGERLIKEGVEGNITMMSYFPYNRVPEFDLPANVHVMVAKSGPWSLTNRGQCAADMADVRAWAKKLHHKVWIWTYPSKYGEMMIKGVPCVGPHAWGRYYAELQDAIIGGFMECESDEAIYNFLNYYVFAHVMWDHTTDVDALLDEAYALMFGAAQGEMKRFFGILEDRWTAKVVGAIKDTPLGPKTVRPDNRTLWTEIYSPALRAELDALLRSAAAKVAADSLEAKRIALMRREFYDRMRDGAADYEALVKGVESLRFDIAKGPLELTVLNARRNGHDVAKVRTAVTVKDLGETLEIAYDCEEPEMDRVAAPLKKPGDPNNWQNNGVEMILNPNGDRKTTYHLMLSHENVLTAMHGVQGSGMPDKTIELPGITTKTSVTASGWKAVFRIPKAGLEGLKNAFPAQFCRYRVRKGCAPEAIQWSSYAHGFCDLERFGTVLLAPAAPAPAVELAAGRTEIVIDAKAPGTVKFAAKELSELLGECLGSKIGIVNRPTDGRVSVYLGDNEWSRQAGIDVSKLERDAFVIKAAGNALHIAGRDDARASFERCLEHNWTMSMLFERATLFGVYQFLEDDAGCRFYLPGELGTITPKTDAVRVAAGERTVTPAMSIRRPYSGGSSVDGVWYDEASAKGGKCLNWLRMRLATFNIPCCHGLNDFGFLYRFKKTHPEYFALLTNGSRSISGGGHIGQLCLTSPVYEEIYQDAKSYLTGEDASVRGVVNSRGVPGWGSAFRDRKYVDIMNQDGMVECQCPNCQKVYNRDPKYQGKWATDIVWGHTKAIAERLTREGVKGRVVQMAYGPYNRIPDFELPENVDVMVAKRGPWSVPNRKEFDGQIADIRAWADKLGHPVWIWTYPGKYSSQPFPCVPQITPKCVGEYYKRVAPYIFGTFFESESDRYFYNHLNYYVLSRVCWDPSVDVAALLDEYYRLMYGPAAADVKELFEKFEAKWVNEIVGNCVETVLGPVNVNPTDTKLWNDIYSPAVIADCRAILDRAAAKCAPGSIEAKRVAMVRRETYEPLAKRAGDFIERAAKIAAFRWQATGAGAKPLVVDHPFQGKADGNVLPFTVSLRETADALVFTYDCDEPQLDKRVVSATRRFDDPELWKDNGVELFLNPDGDGRTVLHWIVNSNGVLTDIRQIKAGSGFAKGDYSWNSGAKARVWTREGGWLAELTIPKACLGNLKREFRGEFLRSRIHPDFSAYSVWSPFSRGPDEVENQGTIVLGDRGE